MNSKLIILDLDETLIYAVEGKVEKEPDFCTALYRVFKRPKLKQFLEFCFQHFEVAVWTSGNTLYANDVVNKIFPEPDRLKFVWSSKRCTKKFDSENWIYYHEKHLKKVKNKGYDLTKVIMIDDSPEKHTRNYGNLVRVKPFYGDLNDNELELLMKYLLILKKEKNIRKIEKRGWRSKFLS